MSRQWMLEFCVKLQVHRWISMEIRWELEGKVLGWKGHEHFDNDIEGCTWEKLLDWSRNVSRENL